MAEQTPSEQAARRDSPVTKLDLVVAAYDSSSHAKIAVRWAAELAQQASSALRVIWAWHMADVWQDALGGKPFGGVPGRDELADLAQKRLDAAVRNLVGDVIAFESQAAHGDAIQVLLAAAAEADMLFIGSRGRGRVGSAVLGSVSARIIREATCPVVVIPPRMGAR